MHPADERPQAEIGMLRIERRADEWLHDPNIKLGGRTPAEVAATDEGADEVVTLIMRFQQGGY